MEFELEATFYQNGVFSVDNSDYVTGGGGGGLAVGTQGAVTFHDFATFRGNTVDAGGFGGGIANYGTLSFMRATYFWSNMASGE